MIFLVSEVTPFWWPGDFGLAGFTHDKKGEAQITPVWNIVAWYNLINFLIFHYNPIVKYLTKRTVTSAHFFLTIRSRQIIHQNQ